jgi:N-acetylmuramoyl-L-alanine amidase
MTNTFLARRLGFAGIVASAALITALFLANGLKAAAKPPVRRPLVVLDAGHGGFDRGGIPRQRVPEKVVALDVAQRLRKKLQAEGYRVVMTRDSDVFIPLSRRVAIANSYRNAIFVSVHFNSARRLGANGIETYYYRRDAMPLAANIHRNVIAGAPTENRGIRRRGYYVLRKTAIPAVLVECGFLTNPTEARLASTSAYREKLADEIARGVLGKPALAARAPASWNYPPAPVQLQPFNRFIGTDFVRADPERRKRSTRSKKSARRKTSRKKKKATSSIHSNPTSGERMTRQTPRANPEV